MSQINRKRGRQWLAAWDQQLATYVSRLHPSGGAGFHALATATRLLRLGHAHLATQQLLEAEASSTSNVHRLRARLERVRALRLAGAADEAEALIAATDAEFKLDDAQRTELEWEGVCLAAQRTGDMSRMVAAVKPGKRHEQVSYLVEASLWAKALPTRDWMSQTPRLSALAKSKTHRPRRLGIVYTCAVQLEQCYDYKIPLSTRLERLGAVLERLNMILTIDRELLILAAAARWLARSKAYPFAALVLSEYRAASLRLSGGRDPDVLGLTRDMQERDWFGAERPAVQPLKSA
jgi:hypothetical protein